MVDAGMALFGCNSHLIKNAPSRISSTRRRIEEASALDFERVCLGMETIEMRRRAPDISGFG